MAIDIGNSRAKIGVFYGANLQEVLVDPKLEAINNQIERLQISNVIVSSVGTDPKIVTDKLANKVKMLVLDYRTRVPVTNTYASPKTLGMDRLAAVVGAQARFPNANCLVIDAGTTITYDFIDHKAQYIGGGISPGIDLRYKSLNSHTFRLPMLNNKSKTPLIGNDTESAIRSGVVNGAVSEIEGIVRRYAQKYSNLQTVLCGGDAAFFESMIKAPIFVIPNLVLIGLNAILLYNVEQN